MNNQLGYISKNFGYFLAIGLIIIVAVYSGIKDNNITSIITTTTTIPVTVSSATTTKVKPPISVSSDLSWCKKGDDYNLEDKGIKTKISGTEKLSVFGTKMTLCCSVGTLNSQKIKFCFNQEQYGVQYLYDSKTKTYKKFSESHPDGNKTCVKVFTNGEEGQELCLDMSKVNQ